MQLRTPFYLALRLFGMMSRLVSQLTLLARNFTAYRSALQIYKTVIHYRFFGASVTLARIENPCLKRFQTRMQIFLICTLIKQQKHVAIKKLHLITHFTKQTFNLNCLLLTSNVTVQLLNYLKQKSPFFF